MNFRTLVSIAFPHFLTSQTLLESMNKQKISDGSNLNTNVPALGVIQAHRFLLSKQPPKSAVTALPPPPTLFTEMLSISFFSTFFSAFGPHCFLLIGSTTPSLTALPLCDESDDDASDEHDALIEEPSSAWWWCCSSGCFSTAGDFAHCGGDAAFFFVSCDGFSALLRGFNAAFLVSAGLALIPACPRTGLGSVSAMFIDRSLGGPDIATSFLFSKNALEFSPIKQLDYRSSHRIQTVRHQRTSDLVEFSASGIEQ